MIVRRLLSRAESWVVSAELTAITLGMVTILLAVTGNVLSRTFHFSWPDLTDPAVVGMPDARLGEVGMAFVVVAPGVTLEPDELVAWSREAMANYKVPRAVELVDELPVNAAGKVEKETLRARAAARQAEERTT